MINCQFENGDKGGLRHVVTSALIVKGTKILLSKRGFYKGKPLLEFGKWSLVGGFLDRDETLEQGIARETKEEIGAKIENLVLFRIVDSPNRKNDNRRQNVKFTYLAEIKDEKFIKSEEVTDREWFDINELPKPDDIAFDFSDDLDLYKRYLKEKFSLPILG